MSQVGALPITHAEAAALAAPAGPAGKSAPQVEQNIAPGDAVAPQLAQEWLVIAVGREPKPRVLRNVTFEYQL
jgi:hypothetical protein